MPHRNNRTALKALFQHLRGPGRDDAQKQNDRRQITNDKFMSRPGSICHLSFVICHYQDFPLDADYV